MLFFLFHSPISKIEEDYIMTTLSDSLINASCSRKDLLLVLQASDSVVPSTSTKPIYTNVLIDIRTDHIVVSASDGQVGMRCVIRRVEVAQTGSILVPAKQLYAMLKESRSSSIHFQEIDSDTNHLLQVELSDGSYHLPLMKSNEFPVIDGFPEQCESIPIDASLLDSMIKQTVFAADKDRTSVVLAGVYMSISGNELILAATDGKVLAECRSKNELYSPLEDTQVIVPTATINHMSRLLAQNSNGSTAVALGSKLIHIRSVIDASDDDHTVSVQVELTSRLIEGSYPSYRNAIPAASSQQVTFEKSDLLSSIKRTALMTNTHNRGIVMSLTAGEALFSNFSHSTGTAHIPVACDYSGENEKLGMNADYMQSLLRVYTGDTITLELNGSKRGMIIRSETALFLIMPISLPATVTSGS